MRSVIAIISLFCLAVTTQASSPMLRSAAEDTDTPPSIYDCLQAASGGDECRSVFDGQCVWCAEPIYGLCVTPAVADKIGMLPFFTCDDHSMKESNEEGEEVEKSAEAW